MSELCPTLSSLLALGFDQRPPSYHIDVVGYRFRFLDLEAAHGVNQYFRHVVFLTGVLNMGRTIGLVDNQIPDDLEDYRTVAAWVAMALDPHLDDLAPLPGWLEQGVHDRHLVLSHEWYPTYPERVAGCTIDIDHARVLRRHLRETIAEHEGHHMDVSFGFDGRVLGIAAGTKVHEALASGEPWPREYGVTLPPGTIPMPARFTGYQVAVAVYDTFLRVGSLQLLLSEPSQ